MGVQLEGLDEFMEKLDQIQQSAEEVSGTNEVPMPELFRPDFMQTYTEFETLEDFFDESPWTIESQEDFEEIPEDEFDEYVDEHTGFDSWEMMLKTAGREWMSRQLAID